MVTKEFVVFYSPGSFTSETTEMVIEKRDVDKALEMAKDIRERYNARPYAFQFKTMGRTDEELNSKVIDRSPTYFFNCKVRTIDDVRAIEGTRSILYRNMHYNGWDRVIETVTGWKTTVPIEKGDVVLDYIYEE